MEIKDELIEELHKYENQWVAILEAERKIVGSGENAYQAKLDAEAKGYPEIALFKVRPSGKGYIYLTRVQLKVRLHQKRGFLFPALKGRNSTA